jgi:hypothetical protein
MVLHLLPDHRRAQNSSEDIGERSGCRPDYDLCREPAKSTLLPVNSVVAVPRPNSPATLASILAAIAGHPVRKKNGKTGTMAPTAKRT